jgi:hypothetical protein
MNIYMSLYIAALFIALTPGVLVTFPKGGSKIKVAIAHGILFAVVIYFTYNSMSKSLRGLEAFQSGGSPAMPMPTIGGPVRPMSDGSPAMPMPMTPAPGDPKMPMITATGNPAMPLPNMNSGSPPSKMLKGSPCNETQGPMCPSGLCINGVCV